VALDRQDHWLTRQTMGDGSHEAGAVGRLGHLSASLDEAAS
jgi:hypothetical protein